MENESAAWSPYLVGALIGVLSMATFYWSNKPLGVSTSYARLAGLVGNLFSKGHTSWRAARTAVSSSGMPRSAQELSPCVRVGREPPPSRG